MIKHFCDICGEEIKCGDYSTNYKLKREWNSWHERGWENLHTHVRCWKELCKYIRERKIEE